MQFQWSLLLGSLLMVPLLLGLYILAQRRRRRFALRYASLALVKPARLPGAWLRRHLPPALFLLALALMLFALARPFAMVRAPSQEGVIILAMDTSGSMRADDVKPSRFEAMRAAARTFIDRRDPSTQIGIVAFAGNTALVQPPTQDQELLKAAINRMTMQRGTAIGDAILASLETIASADMDSAGETPSHAPIATPTPVPPGVFVPAIVVLLSDGQSNRGAPPLDAAQLAAERGVRVYTVGLGTTQGITLRSQFGGGGFRTQLDERTLKGIAEATRAEYFYAANERELDRIYAQLGLELTLKLERLELTAGFTAVAGALLLLAVGLSLRWWSTLSA